jgi:hypothetical protein
MPRPSSRPTPRPTGARAQLEQSLDTVMFVTVTTKGVEVDEAVTARLRDSRQVPAAATAAGPSRWLWTPMSASMSGGCAPHGAAQFTLPRRRDSGTWTDGSLLSKALVWQFASSTSSAIYPFYIYIHSYIFPIILLLYHTYDSPNM